MGIVELLKECQRAEVDALDKAAAAEMQRGYETWHDIRQGEKDVRRVYGALLRESNSRWHKVWRHLGVDPEQRERNSLLSEIDDLRHTISKLQEIAER